MIQIGLFLPKLDDANVSKIKSERAHIISQFVEELNNERAQMRGKFASLTPRVVAVKLGHIKDNHTLYYFLDSCRRYKKEKGSFGKCFWGSLKVR